MNAIHRMFECLTADVWLMPEQHFAALVNRCLLAIDIEQGKLGAPSGSRSAQVKDAAAGEQAALPWEKEDWYRKPTVEDGVAIIPVEGALAKGLDPVTRWWFGITGSEVVQSWIEGAAADPKIKAIVLDVNSPGGMVVGTPELGRAVAAARAAKPVVAYTGVLMASAAYWMAAGASAIYASPSAVVGSIGVYMVSYDWSGLLERMGVKADLFKAGTYKAAGVMGTRLSDAQRENFQSSVNQLMADFRIHVSSYRAVKDSSMEGQTFYAEKAVPLGLVDSISTLEEAVRDAAELADLQLKMK